MITLELVTPENYDEALALAVTDEQAHLIAPMVKSFADAFIWNAHPRVAVMDGRLVGFVMVFPFEVARAPVVNIVRFLIDARFQGQGLGRRLMGATIDWVATFDPRPSRIRISTFPENQRALGLYESVGFRQSGVEDGEAVLWRDC